MYEIYALVRTVDEQLYIGELGETVVAGRALIEITCPPTDAQLGHTLLVDPRRVQSIRLIPDAALMQAAAESYSANGYGGDEAELFQLVHGRYPFVVDPADPLDSSENAPASVPATPAPPPILAYAELEVRGSGGDVLTYLGRLDPTALERTDAYTRFLRLEQAGDLALYTPILNVVRCQLLSESEYQAHVVAQKPLAAGAAGNLAARSGAQRHRGSYGEAG